MSGCLLLDGNAPAEEDHLYELPPDVVQRWFANGRYGRMGTIGDGSCFFHSICYALDSQDYVAKPRQERRTMVQKLRKGLAKRLTKEDYDRIAGLLVSARMPKPYKEILRDLENPSTWAEECMIRWTSQVLGLNVVFLNLSDNRNDMYCGVHDAGALRSVSKCALPDVPTVVVAWVDSSHFELVVRIDSVGPEGVHVRRCFQPDYPQDRDTIDNLMRAYAQSCKV